MRWNVGWTYIKTYDTKIMVRVVNWYYYFHKQMWGKSWWETSYINTCLTKMLVLLDECYYCKYQMTPMFWCDKVTITVKTRQEKPKNWCNMSRRVVSVCRINSYQTFTNSIKIQHNWVSSASWNPASGADLPRHAFFTPRKWFERNCGALLDHTGF